MASNLKLTMTRFLATLLLALLVPTVAVPSVAWSQEKSDSSDQKRTPLSAKEQNAALTSVKPGINTNFIDPELNVDDWIARFEVESREVYQARREILQVMAIQPGSRVADIGAGTGFFSILMNR